MDHIQNTDQQATGHFMLNLLLLMFGMLNYFIADFITIFTFEGAYIWGFRAMSFLSVTCIVLINWRKAWAEAKLIFKRKKNG